jgi:hypothetical protein
MRTLLIASFAAACQPEPLSVARVDAETSGDTDVADEICNGADGDGAVDEDASEAIEWFVDADGDGYGTDATVRACERPAGASELGGDCDDGDPDAYPNHESAETCGDGKWDCSSRRCRYSNAYELEDIAAAMWLGDDPEDQSTIWTGSVGDLNQDGRPDFAVGKHLFTAAPTGVTLAADSASSTLVLDVAQSFFKATWAGDVDGDGRDDLLVAIGGADEDRASAWLLTDLPGGLIDVAGEAHAVPDVPYSPEGWAANGIGDADHDGFNDLATAGYDGPDRIGAWLYRGAEGGVAPAPAAGLLQDEWMGGFVSTVAPLGDIDGDGWSDFAVGCDGSRIGGVDNTGVVALYTELPIGEQPFHASADVLLHGTAPEERAGTSMDSADLDGDGHEDLIVGHATYMAYTDGYPTNYVTASIVLGPIRESRALETADARFSTDDWGDANYIVGSVVRALGDLDGDGAQDFGMALEREGVVYVYYGLREGAQDVRDADATIGHGGRYGVGWSWDSVGDQDGDSVADLVIDSWIYAESRGVVALVPGWSP